MVLLTIFNSRYVTHVKCILRKIHHKFNIKKLWHLENGNWHWVKEKATPIASLNRSLWRLSVPSFSFHFMLGLSAIIATLGLLGNNVAIIIGAMIIAPLMGPIVGMAYSTAMGNRKLLRRSSLTLLKGIILTIFASWLTALIIGLETVDSEIISRTNPTLIDFGIAMAAGMAGAFANTRRSISNALPGVAIAVALVPPLSVVGIGLSLGEEDIALGSSLLFLTNLICIIFFGSIVFLFQSYGSIDRAKGGLVMSTAVMFLLGVPLSFSMRELIIENNVRYLISDLIISETNTFANIDVKSISAIPKKDYVLVKIEVAAPVDSISQKQTDLVRDFLSKKIDKPVELEITIIPVKKINSTSYYINSRN